MQYKPQQNKVSHRAYRGNVNSKTFLRLLAFHLFSPCRRLQVGQRVFWIVLILTPPQSRKRTPIQTGCFSTIKSHLQSLEGGRGAGGGGICTRDWLSPSELRKVRWRCSTPEASAIRARLLRLESHSRSSEDERRSDSRQISRPTRGDGGGAEAAPARSHVVGMEKNQRGGNGAQVNQHGEGKRLSRNNESDETIHGTRAHHTGLTYGWQHPSGHWR